METGAHLHPKPDNLTHHNAVHRALTGEMNNQSHEITDKKIVFSEQIVDGVSYYVASILILDESLSCDDLNYMKSSIHLTPTSILENLIKEIIHKSAYIESVYPELGIPYISDDTIRQISMHEPS